MKTNKLFQTAVAIIFFSCLLTSCKKDKSEEATPASENTTPSEANQILPQVFADSLINRGFRFNNGTTPPVISNIYQFTPVADYDNTHYFSVGAHAHVAKIKIENQNGTHANVFIKTTNTLVDTSGRTLITGSGNNFTIYAQMTGGYPHVYVYDCLFSGTLTATGFQNLQWGFIMISNDHNTQIAGVGTMRIFHSLETIAPTTNLFRMAQQVIDDNASSVLQKMDAKQN